MALKEHVYSLDKTICHNIPVSAQFSEYPLISHPHEFLHRIESDRGDSESVASIGKESSHFVKLSALILFAERLIGGDESFRRQIIARFFPCKCKTLETIQVIILRLLVEASFIKENLFSYYSIKEKKQK